MPGPPAPSLRTCAGCNERDNPQRMVRFRFSEPEGPPQVELPWARSGAARGRGVHVHARQVCLERAVKKGLARALRRPVRLPSGALVGLLRASLQSSLARALVAARRQKALHPAPFSGEPCLRLGAVDPSLGSLVPSPGQVFAGSRQQLGALVDQPASEGLAIQHQGLAARVRLICELASGAGIGGLEVG